MVKNINEKEFFNEIKDGKVLVDFYANWCGPCRMLSPIIEEISEEFNNIKFFKINVDDSEEIAKKYNVMSIPTLIIFENCEVSKRNVGLLNKEDLKKFLGE